MLRYCGFFLVLVFKKNVTSRSHLLTELQLYLSDENLVSQQKTVAGNILFCYILDLAANGTLVRFAYNPVIF